MTKWKAIKEGTGCLINMPICVAILLQARVTSSNKKIRVVAAVTQGFDAIDPVPGSVYGLCFQTGLPGRTY
jgi:hypothetical protein